jgi:hypothetical protein
MLFAAQSREAPKMSRFEFEIAACEAQIARSETILEEISKGIRLFRGPDAQHLEDVTDEHRDIEELRIEQIERFIEAYETLGS